MITIDATMQDNAALCNMIKQSDDDVKISQCLGERFLGAGLKDKYIEIDGTPGNALGAYLDGASITVNGNAQDAVGDTMNAGTIVVYGNVGDAVGYAMRGGKIYIKGNAGYRAGIHIKAYKEKFPVIVIGGRCGSFLGEYQAGGLIIVLGLNKSSKNVTGNFPCTGMHGGKVLIRGDISGITFPEQVNVEKATESDISEAMPYIKEFCSLFGYDVSEVINCAFSAVKPDSSNPYKQMYVEN